MNRRELLVSTGVVAGASVAANQLLGPVKALAAQAKAIRIKDVETFNIELPATATEIEAGVMSRIAVTRMVTESGVRGYSFGGAGGGGGVAARRAVAGAKTGRAAGLQQIRDTLIGTDLFAVEQHLKRGLLDWGGIEEAMWDAIGKVAGQPVYRLLGGSKTSVPVYITAVWRGNIDQSQVPIKEQAV